MPDTTLADAPDRSAASEVATRSLNFREAVNAGLHRACELWPETLVYGEDVAIPGGVFGATKSLRAKFGERVFDTPISESAILGSAIGAAMMGMRPIVEIMWADFSLVALDQLVNQAANVRYVSQGRLKAPITVRTQQGTGPGACAQHSQCLEALYLHVPGLRVAMPATPQDAYDALLAAVACDDPTIVIENRNLYTGPKAEVRTGGRPGPIGGAVTRRPGRDATVVTWGAIQHIVLDAAGSLSGEGVELEVIDARWLNPLDMEAIIGSVTRTGRLMVVHEANRTGGFGAEVVARVVESAPRLAAPPMRIALDDTRVPAAPSLLATVLPDADAVAAGARQLVRSPAAA